MVGLVRRLRARRIVHVALHSDDAEECNASNEMGQQCVNATGHSGTGHVSLSSLTSRMFLLMRIRVGVVCLITVVTRPRSLPRSSSSALAFLIGYPKLPEFSSEGVNGVECRS